MLEKKDLRLKLHPDVHAGLTVLAEVDGSDLAEWAEAVLADAVRRRIHDATVVADRAARLGLSGNRREGTPAPAKPFLRSGEAA
jgi:hypothetical protein